MAPVLFEIAIRMRPRARLWMFSSVMSRGLPANILASACSTALDRLGDRHDVVADAQRLGAGGGVGERFVRGEAVGQHHRVHARRAERVHRHRRAESRVDAARKPEHDAGKAVVVDIVAQAQDAGGIVGLVALLDDFERPLDAAPALVATLPDRARHHRPEGRQLRRRGCGRRSARTRRLRRRARPARRSC